MKLIPNATYIAFAGSRCLAHGLLSEVVSAAKHAFDQDPTQALLFFDATSSEQIDLNFQGTEEDVWSRLAPYIVSEATAKVAEDAVTETRPTLGRPKLGVIAREITLLPRHWEWLANQPSGASATIRKLVEQALRSTEGADKTRQIQESAYRFMQAIAGNEAGFEEASRALFALNLQGFQQAIAAWPVDIKHHTLRLIQPLI